MVLQFVELWSPDGAEIVVGVIGVVNQLGLAVLRRYAALHRRFQRLKISSDAAEYVFNFVQLLGG